MGDLSGGQRRFPLMLGSGAVVVIAIFAIALGVNTASAPLAAAAQPDTHCRGADALGDAVPDRGRDHPLRRLLEGDIRPGARAAQPSGERSHVQVRAGDDHQRHQAVPGDDRHGQGRHRPVPATGPRAQHCQRLRHAGEQSFLRQPSLPPGRRVIRDPGRRPPVHRSRPCTAGNAVGDLRERRPRIPVSTNRCTSPTSRAASRWRTAAPPTPTVRSSSSAPLITRKRCTPTYNLFGKVESGMAVALKIAQGDVMKSITVREQT